MEWKNIIVLPAAQLNSHVSAVCLILLRRSQHFSQQSYNSMVIPASFCFSISFTVYGRWKKPEDNARLSASLQSDTVCFFYAIYFQR